MRDMLNMMRKAKDMQTKMQEMQNAVSNLKITTNAGGGLVSLVIDGKGQLLQISIDPSLLQPSEKEIVEDLVLAAHKDAKNKLDAAIAEKTQGLTNGLSLPAGLKLPF